MPAQRTHGSQTGSQALQTGSHGSQLTCVHGLQFESMPDVMYMLVCLDCAVGKREPVRHQLEPSALQPIHMDTNRATAQNNANFFMISSPRNRGIGLRCHADLTPSARRLYPMLRKRQTPEQEFGDIFGRVWLITAKTGKV